MRSAVSRSGITRSGAAVSRRRAESSLRTEVRAADLQAISYEAASQLPVMNLNTMLTEGVCDRDVLGRRGLLLTAIPTG
jgi:hypothetical protein